jgi:DNA polymerase-3 subunit gamma/tau
MLTKGILEVMEAPRPLAAADMVLVRLCHAAELPTPDEALRMLADNGGAAISPSPPPARVAAAAAAPAMRAEPARRLQPQAEPQAAPRAELHSFEDVVAKAREERDRLLVFELERHVRPVRFEPGQIEIALTPDAKPDLPQRLGQVLKGWTGERWMIAVSASEAAETVHESRRKSRAALMQEVQADPLVRRVLERFPGAEIVSVRERSAPDVASGSQTSACAATETDLDADQEPS